MKKIIMALFFAAASVAAQTGCTTGSGVTCSTNLNLWLLPQHYQNWGVPWNANATAIDAFSLTVPLFNPTATQTIAQPSGTYFNVNNLFVYGTPAVIRFGLTTGTQDGSLSRTGAGTFSLDSSAAGNGLGILTLGGIKVGGSGGTVGQGLCSDGTTYSAACNFITASSLPTLYNQYVYTPLTTMTQRGGLYFTADFSLTDSAGPALYNGSTHIALAASGATAGTYVYPGSITVNDRGIVTEIASGTAIGRTCNTYGCYSEDYNGIITEQLYAASDIQVTHTYTLPFTLPTSLLNIVCLPSRCGPGASCTTGNDYASGLAVYAWTLSTISLAIDNSGWGAFCTVTGN